MTGEVLQGKIRITNEHGLHIRPMKAFVELANKYQSAVELSKTDREWIDGKSIWGLMSLGAVKDTELTLKVAGPDEREALHALVDFLTNLPVYDDAGEPPEGQSVAK